MAATDADPFDLQRFVAAQARVYADVEAELKAGAKTSHWMWFVFPQLKGLGRSTTALHYGIGSRSRRRRRTGVTRCWVRDSSSAARG